MCVLGQGGACGTRSIFPVTPSVDEDREVPPKVRSSGFRFPITSAKRSWLTPTNCYLETCGVIRSLGQSSVDGYRVAQALRFRNTTVVTSAMRGWLNRFLSGDMRASSIVRFPGHPNAPPWQPRSASPATVNVIWTIKWERALCLSSTISRYRTLV